MTCFPFAWPTKYERLLEVVEQNVRAHRFWQRLGFREIERHERRIDEKDNLVLILRRPFE